MLWKVDPSQRTAALTVSASSNIMATAGDFGVPIGRLGRYVLSPL